MSNLVAEVHGVAGRVRWVSLCKWVKRVKMRVFGFLTSNFLKFGAEFDK